MPIMLPDWTWITEDNVKALVPGDILINVGRVDAYRRPEWRNNSACWDAAAILLHRERVGRNTHGWEVKSGRVSDEVSRFYADRFLIDGDWVRIAKADPESLGALVDPKRAEAYVAERTGPGGLFCRKCSFLIEPGSYRFGSEATGWEHMAGECPVLMDAIREHLAEGSAE
jgi:hypothetical protein